MQMRTKLLWALALIGGAATITGCVGFQPDGTPVIGITARGGDPESVVAAANVAASFLPTPWREAVVGAVGLVGTIWGVNNARKQKREADEAWERFVAAESQRATLSGHAAGWDERQAAAVATTLPPPNNPLPSPTV